MLSAVGKQNVSYAQSKSYLKRMEVDCCKLQSAAHCEEAIEIIRERLHEIKRGINVCLSDKAVMQAWRSGGSKQRCPVCGRRRNFKEWRRYLDHDLDVVALKGGQELTLRACTPKCRDSAFTRYQEAKKCLQQQTREMANVKRVAASMKLGLKEFVREARSSQPKEL